MCGKYCHSALLYNYSFCSRRPDLMTFVLTDKMVLLIKMTKLYYTKTYVPSYIHITKFKKVIVIFYFRLIGIITYNTGNSIKCFKYCTFKDSYTSTTDYFRKWKMFIINVFEKFLNYVENLQYVNRSSKTNFLTETYT